MLLAPANLQAVRSGYQNEPKLKRLKEAEQSQAGQHIAQMPYAVRPNVVCPDQLHASEQLSHRRVWPRYPRIVHAMRRPHSLEADS